MPGKILHLAAFTSLLCACSLLAQTAQSPSGTAPARVRQEPCWQQAGIAKSVFEEHQALERDTHSQVRAVCEDTSLTPQQKIERIKEIRQQARQKTDELITPEQQKAAATCRQQRGLDRPGAGVRRENANPCEGQWSRQGARPNGSAGNADSASSTGDSSAPHN
jgi:hypothetical protein